MFPALTEFVQWQGRGEFANLLNSLIFQNSPAINP